MILTVVIRKLLIQSPRVCNHKIIIINKQFIISRKFRASYGHFARFGITGTIPDKVC
jgi:hypothetical protein